MTGDTAIRRLTAAAVLMVAAIAAVVSFVHIDRLAVTHGQTLLSALLLPVSIDGTVAASSLVMLRAARAGLGTPWLARFGLALSVAATLACNVGYGLAFGTVGALISGWPAVAFVICAEMAIGMLRRDRQRAPAARTRAHPESTPVPAPGPLPGRTRTGAKARTRSAPVTAEDAEREFMADLASGTVPSLRTIRARLRVGQDRASQIQQHLAQLATASTP